MGVSPRRQIRTLRSGGPEFEFVSRSEIVVSRPEIVKAPQAPGKLAWKKADRTTPHLRTRHAGSGAHAHRRDTNDTRAAGTEHGTQQPLCAPVCRPVRVNDSERQIRCNGLRWGTRTRGVRAFAGLRHPAGRARSLLPARACAEADRGRRVSSGRTPGTLAG